MCGWMFDASTADIHRPMTSRTSMQPVHLHPLPSRDFPAVEESVIEEMA